MEDELKDQKSNFKNDYFAGLNEAQKEAVLTTRGPLLVVAGAGSGKTRVIEYRTAHLIREGASPGRILLLTFTRRAAEEMLRRASAYEARCVRIHGGTFHSFAYKLLRRHGTVVGLDDFTVLDEGDVESILKRSVAEGGYGKDKGFPKISFLRRVFNTLQFHGGDIYAVIEDRYEHLMPWAEEIEATRRRFLDYKRAGRYLDYDDLLCFARDFLEKDEGRQFAGSYDFLMVDEYQDTNALQGDMVRLLGGSHKNVMAVGDDAQSIYGFRGATHKNIMDFPKIFPGCRIVRLEDNYRSGQGILDAANAVLGSMKTAYEKRLRSAGGARGDLPRFLSFSHTRGEAAWIIKKILELVRAGAALREHAVLFRSSFVSIPLQAALLRERIPFRVFGGIRFYETAHVKDILGFLRVLASFRDELAWTRILLLLDGVGEKTTGRLFSEIKKSGDLDGALRIIANTLSGKSERVSLMVKALREAAEMEGEVQKQIDRLLFYYEPILKEEYDDFKERSRDLGVLREMSEEYGALKDFIADITLDTPVGRGGDDEMLTLSTIHSAKGLEWKAVFFIGMAEGVLPSSLARGEDIEEEMRLFYVGLTRAKQYLFLTFSETGMRGESAVTRFLTPEVLETMKEETMLSGNNEIFFGGGRFGGRRRESGFRDEGDDLYGRGYEGLAVW